MPCAREINILPGIFMPKQIILKAIQYIIKGDYKNEKHI